MPGFERIESEAELAIARQDMRREESLAAAQRRRQRI